MTLVRALTSDDFDAAIALYRLLSTGAPLDGAEGRARFLAMLSLEGTLVLGAEVKGRIASMLTLHVMPNLTNGGRPYALIENVVTASEARGKGLGSAVMQAAIAKAWSQDAYKIMLLTGQRNTARAFYETFGFSADEKWGMTLRR